VGNGKAISMLFARQGARVLLVNRSEERALEMQRQIEDEGGTGSVYPADVTDVSQVEGMVEAAVERYGQLDILVNKVGGGIASGVGKLTDLPLDGRHKMIDLNLTSAMLCSRYAVPHMIAGGGGSIINISSAAAWFGVRMRESGMTAYTTAKAALEGLTKTMAVDQGAANIRVNSIVVGMVWKEYVAAWSDENVREQRRLSGVLPSEGNSWDVGWAAVFLASDEARWVTGVALPVDGGLMIVKDRLGNPLRGL
jgi:NAD(P)-dependent dehydrogenase (short-subunit alcohol dehydrogenase family)